MFTFAETDISFFAGFAGVGINLEEAKLGLVVAVDINPLSLGRVWVSAVAQAESIGFTGSDIIEVTADDLRLVINTASTDGVTADYSSNPLQLRRGLSASFGIINVGEGALTDVVIDLDRRQLGIQGNLTLDFLGVLTVTSFNFRSSTNAPPHRWHERRSQRDRVRCFQWNGS